MSLTKTYVSITTFIVVLHIVSKLLVNGNLTIAPKDKEAMLGQSAHFNCSTSIYDKNVHWYFYPVGAVIESRRKLIYASGKLFNPYSITTIIDSNNEGVCNLTILSVTLQDAGTYECQDNGFLGERKFAQLVVLDKDLSCYSNTGPEGYVGPNSCDIEKDKVTLSCSVSYNGNIPPTLHWKKNGTKDIISEEVNNMTSGNRLIKNLTMIADLEMDGSVYVCSTNSTNYDCTVKEIKVIYAFDSQSTVHVAVGKEIVCKANTTQPCNYTWEWSDGVKTETVSNSQTLIAMKYGRHTCKAECKIKESQCKIDAMLVSSDAAGIAAGYIALIVIFVIVGLTAAGLIWWFIFRKQQNKPKIPEEVLMLGKATGDAEVSQCQSPMDEGPKNDAEVSQCQSPMDEEPKDDAEVVNSPSLDDIDLKTLIPALPFLDKGMTGEIYGPWEFDNKKYVWEKILLSPQYNNKDNNKEAEICGKAEKWKDLDHNNLIKFHCVRFQSPVLYILMDYAGGGTVRRALDSCTENLPNDVVNDWAAQIAKGMNYLREHGIMHGNLKCSQILVMNKFDPSQPSEEYMLKIGSYRLATEDNKSNPTVSKYNFAWMSPEVLKGEKHSPSSDIWSYGVTIWEILTRDTPHKGIKFGLAISEICDDSRKLEIPPSCSEVLQGILRICWNQDEKRRPTFPYILSRLRPTSESPIHVQVEA